MPISRALFPPLRDKMHPVSPHTPLTGIQHGSQSTLLSTRNRQSPIALDLHPALGIGTVEGARRRLPAVGGFVTLGLVDVIRDRPELRPGDVVGELLALGRRPLAGTRDPCVLERDHVVDVEVRGGGPGCTVVRRDPRARGCCAGGVDDDGGCVALEDVFPGVAGAFNSVPCREEVSVIGGCVNPGGHCEGGQLGLGR